MKPRRLARVAALQTLYEVDCSRHNWQSAFASRMADEPLPKAAEDFARELVEAIVALRAPLDVLIQRIASEWPLDQMAIIDRNILRMGVYEVLYSTVTPLKVAINESVELAKLFGSDNSPRFVNGALGTLANDRNTYIQTLNRQKSLPGTKQ
jgi:transcription antitermination protein NusB